MGQVKASIVFVGLAVILLFPLAWLFNDNLLHQPAQRDIWQAGAAVRALVENPFNPANPFVATEDGTRHFQPLWVGFALLARLLGLNHIEILGVAAYASLAIFALGTFAFGRAHFERALAPPVLLATFAFAWLIPVEHTGFHSPLTLLHGAAYPATFMIGFTLLLWAIAIRAFDRPIPLAICAGLTAFMFATHQLGAAIGLAGAFSIAAVHGEATLRQRAVLVVALIAGMLLSMLWPYYNPLELMLRGSRSSWEGGPKFYGPIFLFATFIPAAIGMFALIRFRENRAMLLACIGFLALATLGLFGIQVASRFLMPASFVMHIGLASLILRSIEKPKADFAIRPPLLAAFASVFALLHGGTVAYFARYNLERESIYLAAEALSADLEPGEIVAAHDHTAWPLVATGRKVVSIPWPEPAISDLSVRQQVTARLFDPSLSKTERLRLAGASNVRSLFADERYLRRESYDVLEDQSVAVNSSGPLVRFDLLPKD